MSQPLLSVNGLMMRFGGLLAVNLKVYRGSKLPAWAWCAPSSMCVCSVK